MTAHRELSGRARPATLVREGAAVARSALGATVILGLIVAGLCTAVFATAGRAAAAEQAVAAQIDAVGTRLITVQYTAPAGGLDPTVVGRLAGLSQVGWALGLGPTADASNDALGPDAPAVPSRAVFGEPPPELSVVDGRWPGPGESVVTATSQAAAGLIAPVGALRRGVKVLPVVGSVQASGLLSDLDPYALIGPTQDDDLVTTVYLLTDRPSDVTAVRESTIQLLGTTDPRTVSVTTADVLGHLNAAISGELGASQRALSLGVLGAGMIVTALAALAAVSSRRRDFGRRRALGASRGDVVGLVLIHVAIPAIAGAAVGSLAGSALARSYAAPLPFDFVLAVPVLAICAALVAAAPVAYLAARRDPVRILRVP